MKHTMWSWAITHSPLNYEEKFFPLKHEWNIYSSYPREDAHDIFPLTDCSFFDWGSDYYEGENIFKTTRLIVDGIWFLEI